jgi:hypothetical protein
LAAGVTSADVSVVASAVARNTLREPAVGQATVVLIGVRVIAIFAAIDDTVPAIARGIGSSGYLVGVGDSVAIGVRRAGIRFALIDDTVQIDVLFSIGQSVAVTVNDHGNIGVGEYDFVGRVGLLTVFRVCDHRESRCGSERQVFYYDTDRAVRLGRYLPQIDRWGRRLIVVSKM